MEKKVEATVSITVEEIKKAIAFWLSHTQQEVIDGDIQFDISVDDEYTATLDGANFIVKV